MGVRLQNYITMKTYWFVSYISVNREGTGFGRAFVESNQKWLVLTDAEDQLKQANNSISLTILHYKEVTKREYDFHLSND